MLKKYLVLLLVLISMVLLLIAASLYPGGNLSDENAVGFQWTKNFISNLFQPTAVNGLSNPARGWAIAGMAFNCVGYGIFFMRMAKKILVASAANVLKISGTANILFSFLITTPLHDSMVAISATLTMLSLFYITVFIFKTKLTVFKIACVICMLTFYYTLFLYGYGNWGLLAIMQKVSMALSILLILTLDYFTTTEHFKHTVNNKKETS